MRQRKRQAAAYDDRTMGFFANTQETAEQYGKYITEFQELFRSNDISFGSAEDFFRLAPSLARDESFRDGFTALTRSVQKREEGRLTLTRMLTIVAMASGGDGIETVGDAGTVPVSLLVVFLAGLGGWDETESVPAGATVKGAAVMGTVNGKAVEGSADAASEASEDQAASLEQRLTAGPEQDISTLTTTLFGGPAQVKEALGRLEMNTLQMKMHLDSIDSRMERIEPHLDELKSLTAGSPEGAREVEEPLTVPPVPPMRPWPRPEEEAPRPEWMASAPPMKPWPSEKEQDLAWGTGAEEKGAPARANWPVKETEPVWREPLRESVPAREETSVHGRTLASGAAPLRSMNAERQQIYDEDLPIRVPFDEYLYMEEESRWGRRLASALAVIVIALAVTGGVFYRHHGWHGYSDAVHTVGATLANKKAATMGWFTSQRASTSSAASQNAPKAPVQEAPDQAAPAASGALHEQDIPAASSATQTTQAETAASTQPATKASAPATASQPAALAPAAAPVKDAAAEKHDAVSDATTAGSMERRPERPVKSTARPVVTVLAGSGVAQEDMSAINLKQGLHSTVPVFVDMARLSAVSEPRPEYPRSALARGVTGDVVVQANIARNGDVESAQIVSGPAGLLKPSLDAVRQWRFRPYRMKGEPVEARTYVRFRYQTER